MNLCPKIDNTTIIDATGKDILPTWVDSHTHIVYAGNRIQEFVDRINGLTYEEIANKGGGISNSAKLLQNTSEEDLYNESAIRLEEVMQLGTGAIEIKSGYGLTKDAELKMLRVIKKLKENYQYFARGEREISNAKQKNIQLQNSTFDKFFKKQPSKLFDMVYIDGAHNKKSTLQNFEYLMNHIHNGSVLIFDDIFHFLLLLGS